MCCNCTSTHVSDSGINIYKKPPIYKHGICSFIMFFCYISWIAGFPRWKDRFTGNILMFIFSLSSERETGMYHNKQDVIIESSKFPAAQPPDPNQPSKIETEYWPCPPSLATMGKCTPAFIFLSHWTVAPPTMTFYWSPAPHCCISKVKSGFFSPSCYCTFREACRLTETSSLFSIYVSNLESLTQSL